MPWSMVSNQSKVKLVGVPKGSVLGPMCFPVYNLLFEHIISHYLLIMAHLLCRQHPGVCLYAMDFWMPDSFHHFNCQ